MFMLLSNDMVSPVVTDSVNVAVAEAVTENSQDVSTSILAMMAWEQVGQKTDQ